jgi:hypothetical protein
VLHFEEVKLVVGEEWGVEEGKEGKRKGKQMKRDKKEME